MEGRVAMIPEACRQLLGAGHTIIMEQGAGILSGYGDESYAAIGVKLVDGAAELYAAAQLILKVKEPQAGELALLNRDHLLFSFLHLAAEPELGRRLQEIGLTAVAFETVEDEAGRLPLLAPMSDIAGRIAAQVGTCLLHQSHGGKGLLLGGLPAVERGRVIIIGAGTAGGNAAALAAAAGAEVVVFDINRDRLAAMRALGNNVTGLYPYEDAVAREVSRADIVIGAVLKTGARAPHVVTRQMINRMQAGGVAIDISVDQGGCMETTRPTTYENPTYVEEGVIHFAVTNMPGAVPRTASQALSAALLPYVLALGRPDWKSCKPLTRGINIEAGQVKHPALKETFA
jgi:alanine dehydrogenase